MQKEIIRVKSSSLCVNVAACAVDSLRKVVQNTSTVRVYDNGFIGVAGQIGDCDIAELEKEAIANLDNHVAYPCDLTCDQDRHVDDMKDILDTDHYVKVCQSLLARLTKECPDFIFSNKIKYEEFESDYQNSCNTHLSYKANSMAITLVLKHKLTANIMDFGFFDEINRYDEDTIVNNVKILCDGFNTPVDIEDGVYNVISMEGEFIQNAIGHLSGELYANQASLFKDKLGENILSEKLSIFRGEAIATSFFDAEGSLVDDYAYLLRNGKFEKVLANKKIAAQYNLPRIACSGAAYDSIPSPSYSGLQVAVTADDISDLIGNGKAILMINASGGDMTSTGDYATPCEVAYLVENGKIVGKTPALNITGNMIDFLGKDYVGTTNHAFMDTQSLQFSVARMNVSKI